MKIIISFVLAAVWAAAPAAAYELPSSTGTSRVRFEADEAQFNEYTRIIELSGNVKLEEVSAADRVMKIVRAKNLSVNMGSRTVVSPADFVVDDDTGTIYGKSGEMNYGSDSGRINGARFSYENFIFRGRQMTFDQSGYVYKKASVTSCEAEPPHYRLRASRLYLAPGRYFLSYNNVLFIGKIPVFYFPVLYKPMIGGTPFTSSFFPGYDERNGFFIKSNFAYRVNREIRAKVYLDYFARRGIGMGGELDYQRPEKNISNISLYRIREAGSTSDRWGMNGGYWHSFNRFNESDPAQYYSQSFFRLISDPAFNNDFFRTNPFAVSPDKQASLAFTRQSARTLTRLSVYGREERSPLNPDRFRRAYESAPRLDFSVMPFTIPGLPVLNTISSNFQNVREVGVPYYQKKGGGVWTLSKSVPFSRSVIFSPSVYYDQSVLVSTFSAGSNSWTGRYGGDFNLRYDRFWGSMDLRYSYRQRLREGTFTPDTLAADKGQETQSVYADLFIMPRHNAYFRARTSYDLRDYYTASFTRRLAPLLAEVYYAPRPSLDIYAEDSYSFSDGNRSFVAQVNFGGGEKYFGAGLANYSTDSAAWVVSNSMGFRPWRGSKWRAEAALRYRAVPGGLLKFSYFQFFDKSLSLYRDFHDFRTRWDFRVRAGGVKEFFFFVNLKMNDPTRYDDLEDKARQFWHPWRQEGALRD